MTTTNYNIRIEQDLKNRAFTVFESYGLTPAQAFKLFLNQVADTQAVPLSFDYKAKIPNAVTQAAMQELITNRQTRHLPEYDDASDMMRDIQGAAIE